MVAESGAPLVLLLDTNVLFVRRMTTALRNEGFEVVCYGDASHAVTMLEWNRPTLILCATEFREMGAFKLVALLRTDPNVAEIPVLALGNGAGEGQLQAFRAGCADYIDRRRNAIELAAHIRAFLTSAQHGFRPTQLLPADETSLSGNLAHLDLPGVLQILGQARQTGALYVDAGESDAIIFFETGTMKHAECGRLAGDAAVIQIIKDCYRSRSGTYKFLPGSTAREATVERSSTDLLLDAMRDYDEARRETAEREVQ